MNNQPKVSRIPELINPDTGLREFRFRRYDCLHLRETSATEECSTTETITEETTDGTTTVKVDEQTPFLTPKSRTVVNPTLQRTAITETLMVKAFLRFINQKTGQNQDIEYNFDGSLLDFKRSTTKSRHLTLQQKGSTNNERVNASVFCLDEKDCKEVILTFAFTNYNLAGQSFIDSRHFHIDDREPEIKKTDFIPGKAVQSTTEVVRTELPPVKTMDELLDEHRSDGFVDAPAGPVLPRAEGQALCAGLITEGQECPSYIVDSNLPKPSINDSEIDEVVLIEKDEDTEQPLFPTESVIMNLYKYVLIPENLPENRTVAPEEPAQEEEPTMTAENKEVEKQDLTLKTSQRPPRKPERLNVVATPPDFEANDMQVPFQSIDKKFTYDLAKCTEHLEKAKSFKYGQARGFYSNGSLTKASHYSETKHITNSLTKSRSQKQYSSEVTKQVIEFAGCVLKQRYDESLLTNINDLSYKNGGQLTTHTSHQNGLDADISYPHLNGTTERFDDFTKNMNDERVAAAIDMARIMIYTDRVKTLFTVDKIRKRFCKYIKDQGRLAEFRPLIEDYMYHANGHHNHYHIRVKCNSQNEGCTVQGRLGPDKICG